jgi:hypothetical protein
VVSAGAVRPKIDRGLARDFGARVVTRRWISDMRRPGYQGALELAATVDYLFGLIERLNGATDHGRWADPDPEDPGKQRRGAVMQQWTSWLPDPVSSTTSRSFWLVPDVITRAVRPVASPEHA